MCLFLNVVGVGFENHDGARDVGIQLYYQHPFHTPFPSTVESSTQWLDLGSS